jgi:hypothetical protein
MTNNTDLNKQVAEEVMGWYRSCIAPAMYGFEEGESGNERVPYGGVFKYRVHKWHPSTDIKAAWEVVEKIQEDRGWLIELDNKSQEWYCCVIADHHYVGAGETAPLAICKAALAAARGGE